MFSEKEFKKNIILEKRERILWASKIKCLKHYVIVELINRGSCREPKFVSLHPWGAHSHMYLHF